MDNVNVIALDLYDGKVADNRDSAMKYVSGVNNQRLESIIRELLPMPVKTQRYTRLAGALAACGVCRLLYLQESKVQDVLCTTAGPETNIEKLKQLNADVIGFFGNQDRSPSPEMVNQFEKDMKAAGKSLVTFRYEANHGFANPSNPSFNKEATEDAHKKMIAFFKQRIR